MKNIYLARSNKVYSREIIVSNHTHYVKRRHPVNPAVD